MDGDSVAAAPLLQVQDLCKTFEGLGRGALEVLRDIRFEVTAGEFVSIIGPSGCGKTTLLRILHGLEPATSGAVNCRSSVARDAPCHGS